MRPEGRFLRLTLQPAWRPAWRPARRPTIGDVRVSPACFRRNARRRERLQELEGERTEQAVVQLGVILCILERDMWCDVFSISTTWTSTYQSTANGGGLSGGNPLLISLFPSLPRSKLGFKVQLATHDVLPCLIIAFWETVNGPKLDHQKSDTIRSIPRSDCVWINIPHGCHNVDQNKSDTSHIWSCSASLVSILISVRSVPLSFLRRLDCFRVLSIRRRNYSTPTSSRFTSRCLRHNLSCRSLRSRLLWQRHRRARLT